MIKAPADARLLDLGCGTGDILAYLPSGVDYSGYDVSPEYITAAQRRFGTRAQFTCGTLDSSRVLALPPFDIVVASAVLHHLDDENVRDMMQTVALALRDGGRFVSIDPVLVPNQNRLARFLIKRDRGLSVRDPEGYLSLIRPAFADVRGVLRHRTWIPYTHWMMEGTKTGSLTSPQVVDLNPAAAVRAATRDGGRP
jgi:SAM-dependent methyltransferase